MSSHACKNFNQKPLFRRPSWILMAIMILFILMSVCILMKKAKFYYFSSFKTSNQHFIRYLCAFLSKTLLLSAILDFGGHLELPKDANLASSGFQIRIPIPTYFCKNIFYRRYCTVILGSCRTSNKNTHQRYR